jgi:hypothetical protein
MLSQVGAVAIVTRECRAYGSVWDARSK